MGDVFRTFLATMAAKPTQTYPEWSDLVLALTNMSQVQTGSVTGTGAGLDVTTQGNPRFVIVINNNNGCMGIKMQDMATTNALKLATAPSIAMAANMISLGTNKFTISTDGDLNTAHTLTWVAFI